jgi:hypothetical protein
MPASDFPSVRRRSEESFAAFAGWILLLLMGVSGCERRQEETYEGKKTSEWIGLMKDKADATRGKAYVAAGNFSDAESLEALRRAAKSEAEPYAMLQCVMALKSRGHSQDDALILSSLGWVAVNHAEAVVDDRYIELVEKYKTQAKSLAPDLAKAQAHFRKGSTEAEMIQGLIDTINGRR